jgi:hypothetical protein
MSVSAQQSAFMAAILDEGAPIMTGAQTAAGMDVYRGNYRGALLAAMAESYPRTRNWVGQAAFNRAAAHHVLTNPPSHWSIDYAGEGFAETCAHLFAQDGDVAELARVEWAMQLAFVAADAPHWTAADFAAATVGFGDADWEGLRLALHPSVIAVPVCYNLPNIWHRLSDGPPDDNTAEPMENPAACIIHRADGRAVFVMVGQGEAACLTLMQQGADFATICTAHAAGPSEESAAEEVGAMLAHWLSQGWISGVD